MMTIQDDKINQACQKIVYFQALDKVYAIIERYKKFLLV